MQEFKGASIALFFKSIWAFERPHNVFFSKKKKQFKMNNTIYLTSFVTLCCFNSTRSLTHILIIEGYNERIHCKNRFLRHQQVITEVAYLSLKTASVCIVFQVDLVSSNEVPWEGVKV